ncbi:EAL domain-containing protein [Xanthomonas hortorum]|uniref:Blue light- and temperature-regulated antirepressor BluF n=1 Tax=Xanthomonas hortorum pv. pelargonii TaxID=453602 RepID=A0A6V7E6N0_9XANT|nr:EAL domain-containing protein [Xanthomonas hortorum]MCE4355821.1 EAL domain-containing protein [Xanthomonas hortorum pv. pelargonii]MCM5524779.1 EAL domain-containing protein [Xanthomonas hortorum pv. pelargonii]MCM5537263.1 EAL domain-containing protein [Xanthomonas hortorum pv. pelargonii]MCM5541402.1 EAL domain-containing protein [Xanthomonas hortorum pv. pelargonii]MCM5544741.1 EAL domain-containing protein [Xanthomonas hortorum pv. pelargonii]
MPTLPVCNACRDGQDFPTAITMAFQPIVDVSTRTVYAGEALVRGINGESAGSILAAVDERNRYAFDQACRIKAIECAAQTALPALLSINFMPNAVYNPEHCLRATLSATEQYGWPLDAIIFEVSEQEHLAEPAHLLDIMRTYQARGLKTAIDDFGAGYSGLGLLADFQPDLLKLDIALVRGIDADRSRQTIVRHTTRMCEELGIAVIAEGIEHPDEYRALRDMGIHLQQGYLFARPQIGVLPQVHWPE